MFERRWIMLAAAGCVACISASAQEWKVPQVKLPLETPVFPPRGGQHNQWYQCDTCQIALQTIDDTHYQCPQCKKVCSGERLGEILVGMFLSVPCGHSVARNCARTHWECSRPSTDC